MQSIEKSIYFHFFLKMIFVKADHNVDKIFLFSLFTTLCGYAVMRNIPTALTSLRKTA